MASLTEQIRLVFDAATGRATAEVAKLDSALDRAGKTTTGFQGKANRLGAFLANNWQAVAASAGTAVVAFATKSVAAFQELALAADAFSTSSGLAVEDASRWIEVSGDLGVNAEDVSAAMNRVNRAAASGDLAKFGVTANDANERLVQTVQRLAAITDETKRAEVAAKLLGRGGLDALAPLVAQAGELRDRLAGVSDQKIIDAEEVDKARRLRDAFDGVKDAWEDLQLSVGEGLGPSVAEAASDVATLAGAVGKLNDAVPGGLGKVFDIVTTPALGPARALAAAFENGASAGQRVKGVINGLVPVVGALVPALDDTSKAARKSTGELSRLNDLADDRALKRYSDQMKNAATAADDLAESQKHAADRAETLAKAAEDGAAREAKARAAAAAARQAGHDIPSAELDERDAERQLAQAIRDRDDAMKASQPTLDDEADHLRDIADAHRDVADAQERVVEAREKLVRDRQDSARDIERAEIRLADAKRDRDKAGNSNDADGFKDALDKVRLAELDLQEARERGGQRAVDDQRDIKDAQDTVAEKIQHIADLEAKAAKDRADAAKVTKKDLVDQAELEDRIVRAQIAIADAQLRLNNLRREAIGASPITAPTTPAAARYADSLIGAGQFGPRVDPITGVIPIRGGREGGVIFNQNNSFKIEQALNAEATAREIDRILGRAMASGNFAGRLRGPQ